MTTITAGTQEIEVGKCFPNPWNKRRDLDPAFVQSIREKGILSPILLRPSFNIDVGDGYEIICGERRWRGSMEVGLHSIPPRPFHPLYGWPRGLAGPGST
jgi:ParB family chromosome partitioning protein